MLADHDFEGAYAAMEISIQVFFLEARDAWLDRGATMHDTDIDTLRDAMNSVSSFTSSIGRVDTDLHLRCLMQCLR